MTDFYAVIGANFGDEGKGAVTSFLTPYNRFGPDKMQKALNVLHNGGPQRAHTVDRGGCHHVFRHFGSGAFAGAHTYIADTFIVNPILFCQEYKKLGALAPVTYMHKNCIFTTFYDMIVNQAREIYRSNAKHGSCGLGIFETLCRAQTGIIKIKEQTIRPYGMTVGEFNSLSTMSKINFLHSLRELYTMKRIDQTKLPTMPAHLERALYSDLAIANFIDDFNEMIKRVKLVDAMPLDYQRIVFENGQGLLLDQDNEEYYPHLTPSHTGLDNPINIMKKMDINAPLNVVYVSRTYCTRHGAGRLDNECSKNDLNPEIVDTTNVPNPFQDSLRYAKLDMPAMQKRVINYSAEMGYKHKMLINSQIALTYCDKVMPTIEADYYSFGPGDIWAAGYGTTRKLEFTWKNIQFN